MADVLAKAMAVIMGALIVMALAVLVVTSRPPASARQVVAEFRDAFPIIEGMAVRSDGAPAGSVGKTRVTDQGLASITLLIDKTVPPPRADATATIRQFDSTGDSYINYEPGHATAPLSEKNGKPTIPCDAPTPTSPCLNTLAAPRLDDLINAFGPLEQAGIKLILQSLSDAVESRGADVNRAALRLVPALDAANKAIGEVNGQNTALKKLITDMEAVSRQAGSRRVELGQLIDGLAQTLEATAGKTDALDAGLQVLPATETELRSMLVDLTHAARSGRPLAIQLSNAAPRLSALLDKAPGFLDDLRAAIKQGSPTLDLTRRLLVAAAPTIAADPQRVVTGAFDLAPAVSNLLKGILGGDDTIKGFFGDEKNGAPESRPGFGFGLGAIASEPGDQSGYPAEWKTRNFVRTAGIISCESFGSVIQPGCLSALLAKAERSHGDAAKDRTTQRRRRPAARPKAPATGNPITDAAATVDHLIETLQGAVGGAVKPSTDGIDANPSVANLLDYLLG